MITSQTLFIIIIGVITVSYLFDTLLNYLNARCFDNTSPLAKDIYSSEEYNKSQAYKKVNYRLSLLSTTISFILMLSFLILGGFGWLDVWIRKITTQPVNMGLLFFGVLLFANSLISLPFNYYRTFVIEEQFGFNKMTKKLFTIDIFKSWIISAIFGGAILTFVIWFYTQVGNHFWWYSWGLIVIFIILINVLYTRLIVPMFNKQTPLSEGSLRSTIVDYASKVRFRLDNIYVIDGSKRSTKANAYFSGLGRTKRINLYDTLIDELDEQEVVGVLAHEVGHYQKRHIWYNMLLSIILIGLTLYFLSLCLNLNEFSYALGAETPSFHVGLISFAILYSPISTITGIVTNYFSRVFEYQADNYAKNTFRAASLVSALKKLSKHSLSNLTPHPIYVFVHYSHPPLSRRIENLQGDKAH